MASSIKLFYFFLLPMLLSFSAKAQTHKNITLGSSLSAHHNDDSSWVSPSGDFAFGFQQIENDGFLLAIWFNKISEKTVVWSANRDDLVRNDSKLDLTTNGQLVLYDPDHAKIWSSQENASEVSYAAMLDTGNFVLAANDSVNVWESFDQPTDTLLPTQIINEGSLLIARYLDTNYSSGRFQYGLQPDGNLVLYLNNYPQYTNNFAYWASNTVGIGFQLIFNQSGYVYLVEKNGTIFSTVFSDAISSEDFYQRVTLDSDGVLRHYLYPKSNGASTGVWNMSWTTLSGIPENICTQITADTGSGACGYNSYCMIGDDQRPKCLCPNGYNFMDPKDVRKGCIPNFVQQSCEDESGDFEYNELTNADWPSSSYAEFDQVSEDWCRMDCLTDCFCAVVIYKDGKCQKKKLPLSNGRMDSSTGGKALLKVRKDNFTSSSSSSNKDHSTLILVGSVILGTSGFVNVLFLVLTIIYFLRRQKAVKPENAMATSLVQNFSYSQLDKATKGFKEELGCGASATGENEMVLADWVCDCYKDCSLDLLVENDEQAKDDMNRVKKFVMIALWCIQEDPSLRPTMKKVTQMMEGSVDVPPPPDPCSFISSIGTS
ncbi:hypothetical protein ACFE04_027272 [Oxalis oulophora]